MNRKQRNVLIVSDTNYNSDRRIVSGALRRLAEQTDWSVTTLNYKNKGFLQSVRLLALQKPFDGVIGGSSQVFTPELRQILPDAIFVNATAAKGDNPASHCVVDNEIIANAATDTLLKLGYTNFAFIAAQSHHAERLHSNLRAEAFANILKAKRRPAIILHIDDADLGVRLQALATPVGIFAYNDRVAAKIIDHCHALKLDIPSQVAIIGVDNDPDICNNTYPPLSSVDPDFEACGRNAIDALQAVFKNPRTKVRLTAGIKTVVLRESTQSTKTGGRMVAAARNLLRQRYAEKLTLDGIAASLHISPRLLSLRFNEITGHTVHEELEEIRLTAARAMLESEMTPVKTIAVACGFPSLENFYRRYRRRFNTTPRARQNHNLHRAPMLSRAP